MFGTIPEFNQSLEMFKAMWDQNNTAHAGSSFMSGMAPSMANLNSAMPSFDIEELDKRIKDLKSVESWLALNLNVLKSTIQTLEVQRAPLLAIKSFGDAMTNPLSSTNDPKERSAKAKPRKSAKSRPRKASAAASFDATNNSDGQ